MSSLAGSPQQDANGLKRKSEEGSAQPRAKRNRYISIACNECKRRKIKCNGQVPCQRCGNLNLECVYAPNCCGNNFKDSDEYKQMAAHIASLQEQVDSLYANLSSLRHEMAVNQTPIDPSLQQQSYAAPRPSLSGPQASPGALQSPVLQRARSLSSRNHPGFRGPTSDAFQFDVAKSSLQTMGITGSGHLEEGATTENPTPVGSPPPQDTPLHASKDPIWHIPRDEAVRLIRVYEDEMHEMYPVVPIPRLIAHATQLYTFMESAQRTGLMQRGLPGADAINDEDTTILKLVLAIALVLEGAGISEMGARLFECVQPGIDALLLGSEAGLKGIQVLALAATYEFHRDNEGTAWRVIGLTVRLAIEFGLHRRKTYEKLKEEDQNQAMLVFWAIYNLDRRWSFGTGMPFALQDSDIDPDLPKPGEQNPYLQAMVDYGLIGSKVWATVGAEANNGVPSTISKEDIPYLDYQVIQWHRGVPEHLRFNHPSRNAPETGHVSRGLARLRVVLYLRANAMRIHIYRPVLHSATSIMRNQSQAQTVVDIAKDTIRVLTHINQTSDMYSTSQVMFNAFLMSALAVLFLAVSHTPALFAEQVREEFYMALELIRGFSRGSWVSKKLWKTIRVLKEVGPKLGLIVRQPVAEESKGTDDPSRSAAVAMAGLAGHNMDEMALYRTNSGPHGLQHQWSIASNGGSSTSPENMANDLTTLFEAAGAFGQNGAGGAGAANGFVGINGTSSANGPYNIGTPGMGEGDIMGFGNEEELNRIMRDLF